MSTSSIQTITSATGLADGAWHHVVATSGATTATLFVDGTSVGSLTGLARKDSYTGAWTAGGGIFVGWPNAPSSSYLTGDLDEVAVYPTVLSSARVSAHRTAGSPSDSTSYSSSTYASAVSADSPSLWWHLDDATPLTTVADAAATASPGFVLADTSGGARSVVDGGRTGLHMGAGPTIVSTATYTAPATVSVEVCSGRGRASAASSWGSAAGSAGRRPSTDTSGSPTPARWRGA